MVVSIGVLTCVGGGKLGGVEVLVTVRAGDDRRDSLPLLP